MPIFFHYAHKNTLIPPPYLPLYVSQNHQAFYQTRLKAYGLLWQLGEKLPQQLKKDFQQFFLHIKKDEQGRPQFPHPQIDFNLSHSGDYVAAVLAYNEKDKPKVAIDLEYSLKKRDYATLLKRFASQEEKIWAGEKKDRFYQLWCVREALLKATGTGLRQLRQVQCDPIKKQLFISSHLTGKIYFFHHQPCYLAVFVEEQNATEIEKFLHFSIKEKAIYLVNKKD